MQPRRRDSKKWTSLPSDYLENLRSVLKTQYTDRLKETEVITEGRVFDKEIVLRIGFLQAGRLKQHNFELSMDLPEAKDQTLVILGQAIDFLGSILTEFFEKDGFENSEYEESLPVLWRPVSFNKDVFYFQYSTVNSKLESMANEWLKEQGHDLVNQLNGDNENDAYNFVDNVDDKFEAEKLH